MERTVYQQMYWGAEEPLPIEKKKRALELLWILTSKEVQDAAEAQGIVLEVTHKSETHRSGTRIDFSINAWRRFGSKRLHIRTRLCETNCCFLWDSERFHVLDNVLNIRETQSLEQLVKGVAVMLKIPDDQTLYEAATLRNNSADNAGVCPANAVVKYGTLVRDDEDEASERESSKKPNLNVAVWHTPPSRGEYVSSIRLTKHFKLFFLYYCQNDRSFICRYQTGSPWNIQEQNTGQQFQLSGDDVRKWVYAELSLGGGDFVGLAAATARLQESNRAPSVNSVHA